jgi:hypothetical protein
VTFPVSGQSTARTDTSTGLESTAAGKTIPLTARESNARQLFSAHNGLVCIIDFFYFK